jgi:perosamine synthetase
LKKKQQKDIFGLKSIKVPFFNLFISKKDKKAVSDALNLKLLTNGPKLKEFENAFAKFTGAKYAVGVSNATAALHLALKANGIGKGDEVIIPSLTFVATANAVIQSGATPVLADVDLDDLNISIESIEKNLTSKTKGIIPVHLAGKPCKINNIVNLANKKEIKIIEDCAHAIGTKFKQKHVGLFGNAGCFSFYPTKNMTTIEGGMVITNSKSVALNIISARNHGINSSLSQRYSSKKPWDYDVIEPGYNYRIDEIRSSLGISQLKNLTKMNILRKKAAEHYNIKLKNIKGVEIPSTSKNNFDSHHLYIIRIKNDFKISRDQLYNKLLKNGIQCTVHYKPIHKFSAYKKMKFKDLKNSENLYNQVLSLPFYPSISKKDQDYVISCIKN